MTFAHDTEVALAGAAALVNTAEGRDGLPDVAALDRFVTEWGWTGELRHNDAELQAVRDLRPVLRRFWEADEAEVVRMINEILADAKALPQLVKHGDVPYHLHATPPAAPLQTRMAVEAAMAIVDLVRTEELSRLRICQAGDCQDVVVDLSKNRSKRFCDGGCGNRTAVAAYRARKARPTDSRRP